MSVQQDVAEYLEARLADAYWVVGTSIFWGPYRPPTGFDITDAPMPQRSIFVQAYGGMEPVPVTGGNNWLESAVQIMVCSTIGAYEMALDDAQEVWAACSIGTPPAGYAGIYTLQSQPEPYSASEAGQYRFLINTRLQHLKAVV